MIYRLLVSNSAEELQRQANELVKEGFEAAPGGFQMGSDKTGAKYGLLMVSYQFYGAAPEERPAYVAEDFS